MQQRKLHARENLVIGRVAYAAAQMIHQECGTALHEAVRSRYQKEARGGRVEVMVPYL